MIAPGFDRKAIIAAKRQLPMTMLLAQRCPDWKRKNPLRDDDRHNSFGANEHGWKDHGTGETGDQIDFLQRVDGLDTASAIRRFLDLAGGQARSSQHEPLSRPKFFSEENWSNCVSALSLDDLNHLASWRGYTPEFVGWLKEHSLIGKYKGNFAFPMHGEDGQIVGVHYKHPDGGFRTVGSVKPWIIGDRHGSKWLIFESQWDAFAVMEDMGYLIPEYSSPVTILITRGASNGKFAAIIPRHAAVWAVMQNDVPSKDGIVPSEKWLEEIITASPVIPRVARVPAPHKDANDWLKSGDPQFGLMLKDAKAFVVREGHVEIVESNQVENYSSPTSAISTSPPQGAVFPLDSILNDYVYLARTQSESEDAIIIGSILPIVSRLLARRVFADFGMPKYPNLYHLLVTKPGLRKSTTIQIAESLAKAVLPATALVGGATSEQALFKSYQVEPDKLWIEDEGNTVLYNWQNDAAGKSVAKRMLKLYDCKDWRQNYIRQKEEDGAEDQMIQQTSTSLLFGTTFNNCRFNGLEIRDGMRRRVSYYLSERHARQINWPESLKSDEFQRLILAFQRLLTLSGEIKLSQDARITWNNIQTENRRNIEENEGIDHASEAHGSMLSESPAKILKRAMIFEACRWAKDSSRDWRIIQPDTLEMSAEHERYCVASSQQLDLIGKRAEIRDSANSILARIRSSNKPSDGWIRLTRTQITSTYAANPGRNGSLSPSRLYNEIIPDMIKRNLARIDQKNGKLEIFAFLAEDLLPGERY